MEGMIDGRRLKHAWDSHQLGALLLGEPPYDYEPGASQAARFTRLRQVTDFLRCRTVAERQRPLAAALATLESSEEGWAQAAALFLRHTFSGSAPPPNVTLSE